MAYNNNDDDGKQPTLWGYIVFVLIISLLARCGCKCAQDFKDEFLGTVVELKHDFATSLRDESYLEDSYNEKRAVQNNVVTEIEDNKTSAVIADKFLKDLSEIKEPLEEWDMSG